MALQHKLIIIDFIEKCCANRDWSKRNPDAPASTTHEPDPTKKSCKNRKFLPLQLLVIRLARIVRQATIWRNEYKEQLRVFAFLFHKSMDPFYQNISSFPTAVFTILLLVCVVYWAGAVLGLLDLDLINVDASIDLNADSGHMVPDVLAGLLIKFRLVGVPVVITLTLIFLFGWFICYYLVHFTLDNVHNGILRFLFGIPIFAVSLVGGAWLTTFAMKPFRAMFKNATTQPHKHILGQRAIVRTSRVDNNFGEATLDDGGAGLILKIRSTGEETFSKGDRVVIFEKLNDDNIYRVISEKEFSGQ